jgi:hypothetical protein
MSEDREVFEAALALQANGIGTTTAGVSATRVFGGL